jgi:hypothetical protein
MDLHQLSTSQAIGLGVTAFYGLFAFVGLAVTKARDCALFLAGLLASWAQRSVTDTENSGAEIAQVDTRKTEGTQS